LACGITKGIYFPLFMVGKNEKKTFKIAQIDLCHKIMQDDVLVKIIHIFYQDVLKTVHYEKNVNCTCENAH
jgi:hypothetical protein